MKISCLLLDDDPLVLELLQAYVALTDVLEVQAVFTDPLEAHSYLVSHDVQVLFSDVAMPHLSGLDLVRALRQPPLVVLMTSFPQYAMEAFNLDVIDFLLKPISLDHFLRSVGKVVSLLGGSSASAVKVYDQVLRPGSFLVRTESDFIRLHYRDVLYLEALKDFTKIITADGRTHVTLDSLTNLEEQLPAEMFVRTHHSYVVNTHHIESVSPHEVRVGNHSLSVGQTYRERLTSGAIRHSFNRRKH